MGQMQATEAVLGLLEEKRMLFEEYEIETRKMLNADEDGIEACMCRRIALTEEIDEVNGCIEEEQRRDADLADALHSRRQRDALPSAYLPVYDEAQAILGILQRIQRVEPDITQRMKLMRDGLAEKIRELNKGQAALTSRFAGDGYAAGAKPLGETHFGKA